MKKIIFFILLILTLNAKDINRLLMSPPLSFFEIDFNSLNLSKKQIEKILVLKFQYLDKFKKPKVSFNKREHHTEIEDEYCDKVSSEPNKKSKIFQREKRFQNSQKRLIDGILNILIDNQKEKFNSMLTKKRFYDKYFNDRR